MTNKHEGQHKDETAIEFLRRVVLNCDYEPESLLQDLPSVEAILDFFALLAVYGTDFWAGVLEGIYDGDDPRKARAFVSKYKLPASWTADIDNAIECGKVS